MPDPPPPPLAQSFELTYSAPPAEISAPTHGEPASRTPASSVWVLTMVGGLFGLFVLVVLVFFFILGRA
jgi:hypothetical protein